MLKAHSFSLDIQKNPEKWCHSGPKHLPSQVGGRGVLHRPSDLIRGTAVTERDASAANLFLGNPEKQPLLAPECPGEERKCQGPGVDPNGCRAEP